METLSFRKMSKVHEIPYFVTIPKQDNITKLNVVFTLTILGN